MGFWPTGKKDKLYKQWSEHSGLPVEAVPKKEVAKETPARVRGDEQRLGEGEQRRGEGEQRLGAGGRRIVILYILLAAAVVLLCVGIIILLVQG